MAQSLGIRTGGLSTQSFSWLAKKHHLSENEVRDLDHRYKDADLDRSGQLDKNELKHLLRVTIASAASEAGLAKFLDSQWHNVDRDGNGTVDFDEFLNLYAVLKEESHRARKGPAAAKSAAPAQAGASATGAAQGKASAKGLGVQKQKKPKTKVAKKPRQKTFTPKSELTQQNYVTNEIVWSAIRHHHSFLTVREGTALSGERGNLRNVHSRYSSGLVNNRTVDISAAANGGINLRLNAPSTRRRTQPGRSHTTTRLVSDNRGVAKQITNQLKGYRKGLTTAALARMTRVKASSATTGAASASRRNQTAKSRGRRANQPAASSNAAASQPADAQTSAQ